MTAWPQTWQLRVTDGHAKRQQSELELDHPGISRAVSSAGRQILYFANAEFNCPANCDCLSLSPGKLPAVCISWGTVSKTTDFPNDKDSSRKPQLECDVCT